MTNDNLYKDRYKIVFDALLIGITIEYKMGWSIFYSNNILYQGFSHPESKKNTIHKSGITLSEFINFVNSLDINFVKKLYGDIRLFKLQDKLTKDKE